MSKRSEDPDEHRGWMFDARYSDTRMLGCSDTRYSMLGYSILDTRMSKRSVDPDEHRGWILDTGYQTTQPQPVFLFLFLFLLSQLLFQDKPASVNVFYLDGWIVLQEFSKFGNVNIHAAGGKVIVVAPKLF